jgi:hypothetical protein
LELLPGGAVANENKALSSEASAECGSIPWAQVATVGLKNLCKLRLCTVY